MIKSREVPPELRQFNSVFNSLIYRHDVSQIFRDFLEIVICCLGHGTQEKTYFEVINRYNREELENFSRLFGELMVFYSKNTAENSWCDPLGTYYELLAGNYKKSAFGQFFTPKALCDLMVQMTMEKENFGITVNEPACGSGRLVMAANAFVRGNKYICQDMDDICCQMTAINLAFHKVDAVVYCMNSITIDEPRRSYIINHELWKHKTISILQPNKKSP